MLRVFPKPFYDILAFIEGLTVNKEAGDLFLSAVVYKSLKMRLALIDIADLHICAALPVDLLADQVAVRAGCAHIQFQFHKDLLNQLSTHRSVMDRCVTSFRGNSSPC